MLNTIRKKLQSGLSRDVVWTFSVQIAIMMLAFAINKLLASRLSVDDFGQYNLVKRAVQVLSFVMLAGVGIALPRYIPLYRKSEQPQPVAPLIAASLLYILGVTVLVGLICLGFSHRLQHLVIGQTDNSWLYLVALGYAFSLAMAQFVYAYYRGNGNFRWYNGSQLIIQLAIIVPLVLLPVLTVDSVFIAWLLITTLLVVFYLGRELRHSPRVINHLRWHDICGQMKVITRYASGRLLADFFLFSLSAFPLVYIGNTLGLQATAHYSIGITFVMMVTPLFSFMGIILLPYVSEAIARCELQSASRLIARLALLYIVASLLFTTILYVFIHWLTIIFFAEEYVSTAPLSRIMVLSILPQAIYLLYRNPIDAVAVVPYNTIILGACLATMVVGFSLSTTLTEYAWVYLGVSSLQGLLSWVTWKIYSLFRQKL